MDRSLMTNLIAWKDSPRRKPLILNGARQVGKTWLLKEFGTQQFENVAYVNFDNNERISEQFDRGYDIDRLLLALQAEARQPITPGKTLVVLDEIQECPKAITSLKYFCENVPELAIAAAGSLLGLAVHSGTGFPVGKVNMLDLHPMSFGEFLGAKGERYLHEVVDSGDWELIEPFSSKLEGYLREYYYVGGMPEVVQSYVLNVDLERTRSMQLEIAASYENDMSKHLSPAEAEAAIAAWKSLPRHLAEENKRFIFGHVREGARARQFHAAVTWLTRAGLCRKVPRASKPGVPLSAYADDSIFKLFCLDVGLLGALADLDYQSIIDGNRIFTEFKGALTEQYVCQELVSGGATPYYWSAENSRGEVDFLVQRKGRVYPIEVKAEENLRAKSLAAFNERYEGMNPRRFSLSGFRDQGWMRNIPLYAIGNQECWL